jgi:hypothetical protein
MKKLRIAICLLALCALVENAVAGTVVLKKAFIEKYKNRATIDALFIVDHAHARPNPPAKDGDIHVAGRADQQVGLPMVAEVMNAASEGTAVNEIHKDEAHNQAVPISGVWRLWLEHPSPNPQIQFDPVPPANNTNPDHSFEIHPITKFAGNAVLDSFHFVPGFPAHTASDSFASYEKLSLTLKVSASAVTISSPKAGFNYVDFFIELVGRPIRLDDGGHVVLANVLSESQGEPIVKNIRMIFVAGTDPDDKLTKGSAGAGTELHVLGIPRISLNAISSFISQGGNNTTGRKLPYEMIIVGVE